MTAMTGPVGCNRKLPANKDRLFMRQVSEVFPGALSFTGVMMIPRGCTVYGFRMECALVKGRLMASNGK